MLSNSDTDSGSLFCRLTCVFYLPYVTNHLCSIGEIKFVLLGVDVTAWHAREPSSMQCPIVKNWSRKKFDGHSFFDWFNKIYCQLRKDVHLALVIYLEKEVQ